MKVSNLLGAKKDKKIIDLHCSLPPKTDNFPNWRNKNKFSLDFLFCLNETLKNC